MVYTLKEIKEKNNSNSQSTWCKKDKPIWIIRTRRSRWKSDIDFYIDKGEITDLFKYFELIQDLEEKLQCHVDVITTEIEDQTFLHK